jgi:ABC-type multidrug transport system fused ATPase/permease subunit
MNKLAKVIAIGFATIVNEKRNAARESVEQAIRNVAPWEADSLSSVTLAIHYNTKMGELLVYREELIEACKMVGASEVLERLDEGLITIEEAMMQFVEFIAEMK